MNPEAEKTMFDTIFFENGDYYEGHVIDRVPHGEGTMYYDDGMTVSGRWLYGEHVLGSRDAKVSAKTGPCTEVVKSNGHVFCLGYCYESDAISDAFGVSRFIRGIRTHRDDCVLLSTGSSIYIDGFGWEKDADGEETFVYTGEGQDGDQALTYGNRFLYSSAGKNVYLFIRRRPREYVFHGKVSVKRIETAIEPDRRGSARTVYKFILRRA